MGVEKSKAFFNREKKGGVVQAVVLGCLIVAVILVIGTIWTGWGASRDA